MVVTPPDSTYKSDYGENVSKDTYNPNGSNRHSAKTKQFEKEAIIMSFHSSQILVSSSSAAEALAPGWLLCRLIFLSFQIHQREPLVPICVPVNCFIYS